MFALLEQQQRITFNNALYFLGDEQSARTGATSCGASVPSSAGAATGPTATTAGQGEKREQEEISVKVL